MFFMPTKAELLDQYRTAWGNLVYRTNILQDSLTESEPDGFRVEVALMEVEKARLQYNAARDLLVAQMAGPQPSTQSAGPASPDGKVRVVARILWELAGKPDGTAVTDWLRAERVVRSASAAIAR
jgi:hypothetical protein